MPDQPDEFRSIPLDQIIEPWVVLRAVNRESVEYLELRDSLAAVGPLNSICVRPSPRRPGDYEVVDGLYRHTAAVELRMPALPCIIKHNLTDEDVSGDSDSGQRPAAGDNGESSMPGRSNGSWTPLRHVRERMPLWPT